VFAIVMTSVCSIGNSNRLTQNDVFGQRRQAEQRGQLGVVGEHMIRLRRAQLVEAALVTSPRFSAASFTRRRSRSFAMFAQLRISAS
jgi:hypothetical protein